jgi:hypothetical protein
VQVPQVPAQEYSQKLQKDHPRAPIQNRKLEQGLGQAVPMDPPEKLQLREDMNPFPKAWLVARVEP